MISLIEFTNCVWYGRLHSIDVCKIVMVFNMHVTIAELLSLLEC